MEDGTENIFTWDACRYTFAANKNTEQCPDCGKFAVRGASAEEIENYRKIQIEIAHTLVYDRKGKAQTEILQLQCMRFHNHSIRLINNTGNRNSDS